MPSTLSRDQETELTERQLHLLKVVRERGFATIEALAELFEVSAQTVRRDVIRLDAAGLLQRFHGGAGVADDQVRLGYKEKQELAVPSKARIGTLAAGLVPDGASLYLDVGTTVEAVAHALVQRALGPVFTNNMAAAAILAENRQVEVYVTGGVLRGSDGSLVGDAAAAALRAVAVDVAIIGCSGFAEDGSPMDFDPQKVAVKNAALAHARRAIVVADATKFARGAVMRIAEAKRFSTLVSDRAPPRDLAGRLAEAGVAVLTPDDDGSGEERLRAGG